MPQIWIHSIFLKDTDRSPESDLEISAEKPLRDVLVEMTGGDERILLRIIDETGQLRPHVAVFIGFENCRDREGLLTPVRPGDEISVFPALSGG